MLSALTGLLWKFEMFQITSIEYFSCCHSFWDIRCIKITPQCCLCLGKYKCLEIDNLILIWAWMFLFRTELPHESKICIYRQFRLARIMQVSRQSYAHSKNLCKIPKKKYCSQNYTFKLFIVISANWQIFTCALTRIASYLYQ